MMGRRDRQSPLFYVGFSADDRVPAGHPLRAVKQRIDFSFVRELVKDAYGRNGHVSVDPQIILKLVFLLFFDGVRSERELMRQVGYRLDYLWFLGLRLDDEVPNHSVLSKARVRWGPAVFETVFIRTVQACVEAGLVDGTKLHVDATLVDADASKDSVKKGSPMLIGTLRRLYQEQEAKLDDRIDPRAEAAGQEHGADAAGGEPEAVIARIGSHTKAHAEVVVECGDDDNSGDRHSSAAAEGDDDSINAGLLSTTDPDAAVVRQGGRDPRPRYKHHRAVDDAHGVITAVATTAGDADEAKLLLPLIHQREQITGVEVQAAVADSKYGRIENFLACEGQGIQPHMTDLQAKQRGTGRRADIFDESAFVYDRAADTYRCPAGQTLRRRRHHSDRSDWDHTTERGVCDGCPLRGQCTRSKTGRSIKRHEQQEHIDRARRRSGRWLARRDRRRRKHLIEGSFAQGANRHHLKRSHWRRLWRQQIQDLLIAAVQSVHLLVGRRLPQRRGAAALSLSRSPRDGFNDAANVRALFRAAAYELSAAVVAWVNLSRRLTPSPNPGMIP